jgi:3-hydroxyisobutyrate dehydrogenase-like beta-hydroxyacid dehydrogenase
MGKHVAFFGLGLMGNPMARHLAIKGHIIHLYNRTKSKVEELQQKLGSDKVIIADTAADAIKGAEKYVITMMFDLESLKQTILEDKDAIQALRGKTLIQCQTIGAQESIDLAKQIQNAGAFFIECPVLGHNKIAEEAKLQVLLGASQQQRDDPDLKSILESWGIIRYVGETPKAIQLKLSMNHLVLSLTSCFSNSLAIVQKSGIDTDLYFDIIKNSNFHFKYIDIKMPRMLEHKYEEPNFTTEGAAKDAHLIHEEVKRLGIYQGITKALEDLNQKTIEKLGKEVDMAAVHEINMNPK